MTHAAQVGQRQFHQRHVDRYRDLRLLRIEGLGGAVVELVDSQLERIRVDGGRIGMILVHQRLQAPCGKLVEGADILEEMPAGGQALLARQLGEQLAVARAIGHGGSQQPVRQRCAGHAQGRRAAALLPEHLETPGILAPRGHGEPPGRIGDVVHPTLEMGPAMQVARRQYAQRLQLIFQQALGQAVADHCGGFIPAPDQRFPDFQVAPGRPTADQHRHQLGAVRLADTQAAFSRMKIQRIGQWLQVLVIAPEVDHREQLGVATALGIHAEDPGLEGPDIRGRACAAGVVRRAAHVERQATQVGKPRPARCRPDHQLAPDRGREPRPPARSVPFWRLVPTRDQLLPEVLQQ